MITKLLRKYNIPKNSITRTSNGGHVYGFRKYGGRCVALNKEQKVIEIINSYREEGVSYQRIAECLNEMSVETKTNRGVWFPKVVRKVYLRNKVYDSMVNR